MFQLSQYCLVAGTILAALSLLSTIVLLALPAAHASRTVHAQRHVHAPATARRSGGGGVGLAERPRPAPATTHPEVPTAPHGLAWYTTRTTQLSVLVLTVCLVLRAVVTGHGPFANQHEFAVSFAWGMLLAYVYFEWKYQVRSLALLVLPVAVGLLVYSLVIDTEADPLLPALQNNLLLSLHVATAVISYGAAAVAFAAAVLFLVRDKVAWRGLPDRELLDEIGYRAAVMAYPLMTVMIILGAIWADIAWGTYWSWDPKETAALVTWLIYGAYLHARVVRDWRGSRAAWLLILGFAAVLFTYFGNLFFGGAHAYA